MDKLEIQQIFLQYCEISKMLFKQSIQVPESIIILSFSLRAKGLA